MKPIFQLRFTGGGVTPTNVPLHELAELLLAAELAITSIALHRNPSLDPESVVVGLVQIEERSLGLQFSSNAPDVVLPAFHDLAERIGGGRFSGLPGKSIRALRTIAEFTSTRNCRAQFWNSSSQNGPLAEISPGFEAQLPEPRFIRGETTVFGILERVGGVEPRARLRLPDREVVSCYVSESLARELGPHLYSEIGLRGFATWDATDHSLAYFRAEDLVPFEGGPVKATFNELRQHMGGAYDTVPDVVEFVRELRGGSAA